MEIIPIRIENHKVLILIPMAAIKEISYGTSYNDSK